MMSSLITSTSCVDFEAVRKESEVPVCWAELWAATDHSTQPIGSQGKDIKAPCVPPVFVFNNVCIPNFFLWKHVELYRQIHRKKASYVLDS